MREYLQKSTFEGELVRYYEIFFDLKKKAPKHIAYMKELLGDEWGSIEKVWDIGCGTGMHASILSEMGKSVVGLDYSEDMIWYAKKYHHSPSIQYVCNDIRGYMDNNQYDLAYAMSHVIGYQWDNLSVERMLTAVYNGLRKGGIFLFNFYQQGGIFPSITGGGGVKAKRTMVNSQDVNIVRFSNAEISVLENTLHLDYYYIIKDKHENDVKLIQIEEKMRYFSLLEIMYYLQKVGFGLIGTYNFGSMNELEPGEWNACVVAKKGYI